MTLGPKGLVRELPEVIFSSAYGSPPSERRLARRSSLTYSMKGNSMSVRLQCSLMRLRIRPRLVAATGFVALLGTAGFAVPTLSRHIGLASSVPAKDAHVATSLREIRLTFTGTINVAKAGVELISSAGKTVALDSLRAVPDSSRVAVAKVTGPLTAGTYTIKWRAVAQDGANGSGSFSFMYMPATKGSGQ